MRSAVTVSRFSRSVFSRCASSYAVGPIQVLASPGSRVLELSKPEDGNKITESLCTMMINKLNFFEENKTVGAIFVASHSPDTFSVGLENAATAKAANELAARLTHFKKQTVAIFSGETSASAYGVFAGCTYRLGTPTTAFTVGPLSNDELPRGGGLAHHLVKGSEERVAMARYLAISGRTISAHDMRAMGLLTHIVEEEPHVSLAHSFAHTIPADDHIKSEQTSAVDSRALEQLLDTMDINDVSDDAADMMDHELWDKMMLVKPIPISDDELFYGDSSDRRVDLEDHVDGINHCFSTDNVEECKKRLEGIKEDWSEQALQAMNETKPQLLQTWFKLTKVAVKEPIDVVFKAEERQTV